MLTWGLRIATFLILTGLMHAQSITGSIVGTVSDTSGSPVPAANVQVQNQDTGAARTVVTNEQGNYAATLLPPGRYTVSIAQPGFKPSRIVDLEVRVDRSVRADLSLQLGEVSETITVSDAASTKVETDTSTLNQTLGQKTIVDMPISRSFVSLAGLTAGVVPVTGENGQSLQTSFTNRGNLSAFVSGQRESSVSFLIDGVESRGERLGNASMPVSVDAIQQFGMLRNTMSAEYGNAAAVMNISIKSGTNQIHGTAFEFLQNSVMNARNYFDTSAKAQTKLNDFGFSLGGPLVKDKTFFFTNFEGIRSRRTTPLLGREPTQAQLGGDLSSISSVIYDPLTTDAAGVRTAFPGNIIPVNRLDPATKNFSNYIPVANLAQPINNSNLSVSPSAIADSNQVHFRVDHALSSTDQLFGRWSYYDAPNTAPSLHPLWSKEYPWTTYNGALQETHVFGPRTVNEFRFGYSRDNIFQKAIGIPGTNLAQAIGLKNTVPNEPDGGALPGVTITGYNVSGGSRPTGYISNRFQYSDVLSLTRGNHVLKLGADTRRLQYNVYSSNSPNGDISFAKIFTTSTAGGSTGGDPLADYLLGAFNTASGARTVNSPAFRNTTYNFFAQDEWKVTSRLHLSLGLRYEYAQRAYDVHNKIAIVDFSTGNLIFARKNPFDPKDLSLNPNTSRALLDEDYNNFAPRFGFSYDAGKDTVIRGGYGIFYDVTQANELNFLGFVPPFQTLISVTNNPKAGTPGTLFQNLFPNPGPPDRIDPGTSTFSHLKTDRTPYVQQFNFNIQKRIFGDYLAEASYVGTLGRKQSKRRNYNQKRITAAVPYFPLPNLGPILTSEKNSNSSYNALQLRLERQFKTGWSLLANYTYSKSIDMDSANASSAANQDATNLGADRGLSDFDVRHRFTAVATYELPFARNAKGIIRVLAAGWQTSAIATMQGGFPLTISAADTSGAGSFTALRANRIGAGNLDSRDRNILRWFDTAAFVAPPSGTFGTAGRNIIIGPGTNSWNLAAMKNTSFLERYNLQFRAEFFNAFNHTQWFAPATNVSAPLQFGRITSARAPRNIQLALKLYF
ncbi:TonB-dependent receptor domain-containing protein [uncultured Paludibaculum sp.]|uniref:TonB-dependent receptor n=1 Tax=uncultured Paludibaculum sp. TaxID=1765020 RepID=UPI002AAA6F6E|nr:TonB-dependent receptor [uncultured Paludibaculum sp.]